MKYLVLACSLLLTAVSCVEAGFAMSASESVIQRSKKILVNYLHTVLR